MGMAMKLADYLATHPVPFDLVVHSHTRSSLQSARSLDLTPGCLVKAVVLEDENDQFLMAVLPASRKVDLGELRRCFGRMLRLADKAELRERFGDCELGAVPPIGSAYGMETIWDDSLMSRPDVYFEAGDHETSVHVKTRDFVGLLEGARHLDFSAPMQGLQQR
jgi:Ala-tRNA(Pro) deacylase